MIGRLLRRTLLIGGVCAIGGYWFTRPQPLDDTYFSGVTGDATRGANVFAAAGCGGCHIAKDGDRAILSGGQVFATDFGSFVAPNISPDPVHGVGAWSDLDLASAIVRGVSPGGAHLYPAFPYTSYANATPQDIADLIAHLRSLPASDQVNPDHDLRFPYSIRATLGVWKALYAGKGFAVTMPDDPQLTRGQYLVEALGHCAECHTPRDALGGLDRSRWMAGAPVADGEGRVPAITPAELTWSAGDIASYLQSGFTPEFDTAGGAMAEVVRNTALLSDDDRAAIAAYLKALP